MVGMMGGGAPEATDEALALIKLLADPKRAEKVIGDYTKAKKDAEDVVAAAKKRNVDLDARTKSLDDRESLVAARELHCAKVGNDVNDQLRKLEADQQKLREDQKSSNDLIAEARREVDKLRLEHLDRIRHAEYREQQVEEREKAVQLAEANIKVLNAMLEKERADHQKRVSQAAEALAKLGK